MANDSILIQVQLGTPTRANINAVTRQIQSALSNVSANVQIQNGRQATQTLQNIKSKTDAATKSTASFADAIGLSARRFVAFTSAVAVVGRLTSALSQATREAIKFEREFVKLAQVFDTDVKSLGRLQNSMSELAQEFGLSATVIAKTSVVLAQSGLTAKQTEQAMRTLAKTTLAATFDSIAASTEGAVAIMAQFGTEASKLESQLGAINAVSKKFAVESGDIIEAVRRAGGAFRAAGGNLNEFIALFTSVRSTTRESAETIATGFRTIFARLQRPKTIDFFRQLNIELTDGRGNFIGAFEAVRRLSKGLEEAGIKAGSIKFAGVVEQLGGIRQVSRVIPLLQQFTKAEKARQVAIGGAGSLDKDAAKAQETLAQSFARTTENFRALIREISQTATFQAIVKIALDLANAFIEVARSLKPLIPLIAAFGAIKLGGLASGALKSGVRGAGGTGGLGKGFKRGGPVPGTGSGDTVPAMLEPGEFVIRKSAVQAFGTDRLSKINKYAPGGKVGKLAARKDTSQQLKNASVGTAREPFSKGLSVNSNDEFLANVIRKDIQVSKQQADNFRTKTGLNLDSLSNQAKGEAFEKYLIDKRITTLKSTAPISKNHPVDFASSGRYGEAKNVAGRISDQTLIDKLWRSRVKDGTYGKRKQTPTEEGNQKIDLGSITLFQIKRNYSPLREKQRKLPGFNKGGAVGTDTVPALLTPGEFVINKESAKSFGYGNLGKINKYAKGGPVQKFANGGDVGGGGGFGKLTTVLFVLPQLLSTFAESIGGANSEIGKFLKAFGNSFLAIAIIAAGIKQLKTTVSDFVKTIGKKDRIVESKKKAADAITRTGEGISIAGDGVGKGLKETLEVIQFFNAEIRTATGRKKDELKKKKDALFEGTGETSVKGLKQKIRDEEGPPRDERGFAGGDNRTTRAAFDKFEAEKKARRHAATAAAGGTFKDAGETEGGFGRRARGVVQAGRRKLRGSAGGKAFDKVLTGGSKALAKLPGPIGAVVKGLKVLNAAALVVTAGFIASFKVAGENAKKASEEAIKDGKVQEAQREAIRSAENEKAAKDLTLATGVVQGFLGPFAGLVQPLLILLSATGALGKIFDFGKTVFNNLVVGVVKFLDTFGLIDQQVKAGILESIIDPATERLLTGFQAGLDASIEAIKLETEQRKKLLDLGFEDLRLLSDEANIPGTINKLLEDNIKAPTIERVRLGQDGPVQRALLTKEAQDRVRDLATSSVGVTALGGGQTLGPAQKKAAQKLLEASEKASAELEALVNNQLSTLKQTVGAVKGDFDSLAITLGLTDQKLKFVSKDGLTLLSNQSIESSGILKTMFLNLTDSGKSELQARKDITKALLGEKTLREANADDLKRQQGALSNLLEKFTFATEEQRAGIGRNIDSARRLVSGEGGSFNIDKLGQRERGEVLSFLKSVPGANIGGVRSEDIVIETILKKFEGTGLEKTVFSDPDRAKQLRNEKLDQLAGEKGFLTLEDKKKAEIEAQRQVSREILKEQLFPELAQIDELKNINKTLDIIATNTAEEQKAEQKLNKEIQARRDDENKVVDSLEQFRTVTADETPSIKRIAEEINRNRRREDEEALKVRTTGLGTPRVGADFFGNDFRTNITETDFEDSLLFGNTDRIKLIREANAYRKAQGLPLIDEIQYRAAGGTLVNMQPQGTDTVPAMLTPGEFVINAQSASRLGLGTLTAMNNYAKGGPVKYFNQAGGVKPLTPKELEELEEENKRLRANAVNRFQSDTNEAIGGIRPGDARSRILYGEQYAGTRREIFNSRRRLSQRNIAAYEGMGRGSRPTDQEIDARIEARIRPITTSTGTRARQDFFNEPIGSVGSRGFISVSDGRGGSRLIPITGGSGQSPDFGPSLKARQSEADYKKAVEESKRRNRQVTKEFGGAGAVIGEDGSFQGFMDGMSSSDPISTAEQLRIAYRQKQFKRAVATGGTYAYQGGRSAGFERRRQQALNRSGARKFGIQNRKDAFAAEVARVKAANPKLSDKRARGVASRQIAKARKTVESLPSTLSSMGAMATDVFNSFTTEANVQAAGIGQTPTVNITDQAGLDQVANRKQEELSNFQITSIAQPGDEQFRLGPSGAAQRRGTGQFNFPQTPGMSQFNLGVPGPSQLAPPVVNAPVVPLPIGENSQAPLVRPEQQPATLPEIENLFEQGSGFHKGGFVKPQNFNKGGPVGAPQYLNRGGSARGGGMDTSALNSFANNFGSSVSQLVGSAITLEVAPMGVNINLNGAELLAQLPQMVQRMVIGEIQSELSRFEQTRDFNNTPGAYASSILA